jgi:glycosyltransferase involved in cell wall biosynthesis
MPKILVTSASYVLSDHLLTSEGDHCYNFFKQMRKYDYQFEAISSYVDIQKPLDNVRTYKVGTFKALPSPNVIRKYVTHTEFLTRSTLKAVKLLKQQKIDIIHHMLPTVYNQTFSPFALAGKTEGYPYIVGPASAHFFKRPIDEKIVNTFTSHLHKATIKRADKLITLTTQVKKLYNNIIEEDKTEVIPFAVDAEVFKPSRYEEKNEVLYVGSLFELKGIHHLIKAIAEVIKEKPETRLRIVGEGPQRTVIEDTIHNFKLRKNAIIEGVMPHNRIALCYQRCSFFCFPTQGEPFGKAVIEAMACAKPVIATNIGGPKETVLNGKTGFLVPPGQPKILAEKILVLLEDDMLRRKMGRNARRVVLEKYSWPRIAEKYHQIYQSYL